MRVPPRASTPSVVVGVLGVVTLYGTDGAPVSLTDAERRVLAVLTATDDDGASTAQLEDAVWEGSPPRTARQSLHNHVHRLRCKLDRTQLVRSGDRYRLEPRPPTDTAAFVSLFTAAGWAMHADDAAGALVLLRQARVLWRGEPYADLVVGAGVAAAQTRLQRLRNAADDLFARALLADGQTEAAIIELERLVVVAPGDEARHELLVEALHRAGRRADGLAAFRRAREGLLSTQGIEPGDRLQALQRLLLQGAEPNLPAPLTLDVVGRDEILEELLAELRAGGRVAVHGEGGIGKSALARGVVSRWAGEAILIDCGGDLFAALAPVAALIEVLAPRLERAGLPASLDTLANGVAEAVTGSRGSPGTLVRRAVDVIAAGLAGDADTLLVLDDVDRCGPTTRAVLGQVVTASPVAVLTTAREAGPPLPGWPGADAVALGGLDVAGVVSLAGRVLQAPVSGDFGEWLHRSTEGHPLFVIATLSDLIGRGLLTVGLADPRPLLTAPVPAHIREALQRRIAGLGSRARRAVDVVAVVGHPVSPEVLADLVDPAELEPAVREGLLVRSEAGTLAFSHELLRRVAYDYVPSGRRAELHHAVAGLDLSVAHRAEHLLSAFDLDPLAALDAATRAGAEAVAAQAYEEGASWYLRALDAGDGHLDDLERLRLRIEAADAQRLGGVEGHAAALLDAAVESLRIGDVDLRRRAVLAMTQLGGAVEPGATQQRAAALAEQTLAAERDPAWWARIAAAASMVHSIAGTPVTCRELFVRAWSTAPDDDAVLVDVLPYAYLALAHPDDLDDRSRAAVRLATAAERERDPVAAFEAGHLAFSVALQRADGTAARRAHRDMSALTDRVADAGRRWSLAYQAAALAALDGRLEEAETLAGAALEIGSGVAPSRAFGAYAGQVFELRRLQGRLTEVAELTLQLVSDQPEIPGWAAVGSLALASVDPDRSRALFDVLVDPAAADHHLAALPRDFAWLAGAMSLGRAAVALADGERARRICPVLLPYADLVCWQGTCSWGSVAEVLAGLTALAGEPATAQRFAGLAEQRRQGLSAASSGSP